jgi:hypothetical protein
MPLFPFNKPLGTCLDRLWPRELWPLALSVSVQLTLALFFGHLIDMRVNMAAGFLTAAGQNPYLAHDLSAVFHSWLFKEFTTIGYPPPWPLLLALIYKCVYAAAPGLLAYNLAIKLPIIAANIWLAFLVKEVLGKLGVSARATRSAWIFMLFNPFILYATAAWGQIDSIVAALSLAALILLDSGKYGRSAFLLGLAIAFKPIALPLVPVAVMYLLSRSWRQAAWFGFVFSMVVLFSCAGPFIVFGWDPAVIVRNWNVHFIAGGGMSFLAFLEFIPNASRLNGQWQLAGFLWVPALCLAIFFLRGGIGGLDDLLKKSAALLLVFFLTRSWLSEPNIVVLIPFLVIAVSGGGLPRPLLHAVWVLTLAFSIFNASVALVFFPGMPHIMEQLLRIAGDCRMERLIARSAVVTAWFIAGWAIVAACMKKGPLSAMAAQR